MSAALCEVEAEPRSEKLLPSKRSSLHVETDVRLEGREQPRAHRKDAKEVAATTDRKGMELGIRPGGGGGGFDGNLRNSNEGRAELTAKLKDCSKPAAKQLLKGGQKMQPAKFGSRNAEVSLPVEEDRDAPGDGDVEEGNGTMAETGSERHHQQRKRLQQQPPNIQNKRLNSQHKDQHQHQPPSQQEAATAAPAPAAVLVEKAPSPARMPAMSLGGWENFLPRREIKILLAEDDDSTRQVVGALLRNCNYEVSSVSNGMQAWEMLEDPDNHFDLVLTDVVMPSLSGVGLLTKIMSNEAGKRIPVIMMSSHDSLDIVFRCLLKGAADFLVKPVRKNELKNLWQHVWRCRSSSGSGSGGGSRSGSGNGELAAATKTKRSAKNGGSNDGSDDSSSGLNVLDGSDNGSGTQAVLHAGFKQKREKSDEEGQATSLHQKLSNEQIMGQDLEMATRRTAPLDIQNTRNAERQRGADPVEEENEPPSPSENSGDNKLDDDDDEYNSGAANSGGSSVEAIDLIGGIAFQNKGDVDEGAESGDGAEGIDRRGSNSPADDKCVTSSNSPPLLELSLKRPRPLDEGTPDEASKGEKRVLRQSGSSAFSRYSTNGTTNYQMLSGSPLSFNGYSTRDGFGPSHSHSHSQGVGQGQLSAPLDRQESVNGRDEQEQPQIPLHLPRPVYNNGTSQEMGSSMVGSSVQEGGGYSSHVKDEALPVTPMSGQGLPAPMSLPPSRTAMIYDGVPAAYGQAVHPIFYAHHHGLTPPWANAAAAHLTDRAGELYDHSQLYDHGSHSHTARHSSQQQQQHHLPHHQYQSQLPQPPPLHNSQHRDDQVVLNHLSGPPRCGSSNMAGSVPDDIISGGGDHEQNRFARREAALNKFRQKRKDRCFEKKVRYQSRKRLAEQRPRVRGQFVRQTVYDSNTDHEIMAD